MTALRIAITRAQPDAARTAARVRALGAEAIVAPLLAVLPHAFDPSTDEAQALLFTSASGVRAFASVSAVRALPVLTVGAQTAAEARALGFADVRSADGDSQSLAALAITSLAPQAGKVLHISGAHVAGDITAALTQAGYSAERRIAYEAVAAAQLPPALADPVDVILFHSARAGAAFVALGAPNANETIAACLSPAVAQAVEISPLERVIWRKIIVSPHPREEALLQAALASAGASA